MFSQFSLLILSGFQFVPTSSLRISNSSIFCKTTNLTIFVTNSQHDDSLRIGEEIVWDYFCLPDCSPYSLTPEVHHYLEKEITFLNADCHPAESGSRGHSKLSHPNLRMAATTLWLRRTACIKMLINRSHKKSMYNTLCSPVACSSVANKVAQ